MSWFKRKEVVEKSLISINDEDIDIKLIYDGVQYDLKDCTKFTNYDNVNPHYSFTEVFINAPLPKLRQRGINLQLLVNNKKVDNYEYSINEYGRLVMSEYSYCSTGDYSYKFVYEPESDEFRFDFKIEVSYDFKTERTKKEDKQRKLDCMFKGLTKEDIDEYFNKNK